jgi:outer membrane protein assembly factor BamB
MPPPVSATNQDSGWRISPENINIQEGEDRTLQLLNDSAQELHGAKWSVDNPTLATIREENNRAVVHANAPGRVTVHAVLHGEKRLRQIEIWAVDKRPLGTTGWGTHPIGREINDISAAPTPDGPHVFSLEQTADGSTYLRAVAEDGIQIWNWLMPEKTRDVELVCGDWTGGALISANRPDSFTLYTVGNDGKLRWQQRLTGIRKSHAYNRDHLVNILSQSADDTTTALTGFDEITGTQKFQLTIPTSQERLANVRKTGTTILCTSQPSTSAVPMVASRLFVNIDGFAYLAFTKTERTLTSGSCPPGSVIQPRDVTSVFQARMVLWQIHPDGSFRSTVVEESQVAGPLLNSTPLASPTGAIIPDGLGGVLLSVRRSRNVEEGDVRPVRDEFVYRLDQDGKLVYRFPLPRYGGALRDEMVLGERDRGFVTRGGLLIAFDVRNGTETWRWDSRAREVEVYAALANGGCAVQTPTALVEVDSATDSKEIMQGRAMVDWQGQIFRKHI